MINKFTLVFLLLFAFGNAKEIEVLKVHYDEPQETVYNFILSLDECDNVFSLTKLSANNPNTIYSIKELQTKEVVVSMHRDKKVILLSCPNYNPSVGGPFNIKYLHNGLTNSYKTLSLWLEKDGEGWQISTPPPRKNKINALKVVPRKLAGVTIGVQHLKILN